MTTRDEVIAGLIVTAQADLIRVEKQSWTRQADRMVHVIGWLRVQHGPGPDDEVDEP